MIGKRHGLFLIALYILFIIALAVFTSCKSRKYVMQETKTMYSADTSRASVCASTLVQATQDSFSLIVINDSGVVLHEVFDSTGKKVASIRSMYNKFNKKVTTSYSGTSCFKKNSSDSINANISTSRSETKKNKNIKQRSNWPILVIIIAIVIVSILSVFYFKKSKL